MTPRLVFIGGKVAAERRLDAKNVKVVCGDSIDSDDFTASAIGQAHQPGGGINRCDSGQRVIVRAPIEIVRIGRIVQNGTLAWLPHLRVKRNEFFRVRQRQRAQQDAIDQAINGGRCSNAKREGEDRGDRNARRRTWKDR
jgi:hypothetical protein